MAVIHFIKSAVFTLTGELTIIHCLSNSFSSSMFISKKKLIPAMRSFKGTRIISAEFSQPSILSTVLHIFLTLKFADIQFCQRTFFKHNSEHQSPWNKLPMEESIFSVQHQLYWSESNRVKHTFSQKYFFFRILGRLDHLLLFKNYCLVTNTFSDELLLEDKYFFSAATVSQKLFLQNK